MATDVVMPLMGESIHEGTVTRWLVAVGDHVDRDQAMLEISTDKVDAEIHAPTSGTVLEILHGEGETVEVDGVLARIGAAGESVAPAASPAVRVGEERATSQYEQAPAAADVHPSEAPTIELPRSDLDERMHEFASPVVRRIAEHEGIDIRQIEGTGIQGRVTKRDILQYLEDRDRQRGMPPGVPSQPAAPPALHQPAASQQPPATRELPPPEEPLEHREQPASEEPSEARQPTAARPSARVGDLVRAAASRVEPRAARTGAESVGEQRRTEIQFSVPAYSEDERVEIEPMSPIRRLTAAHMLYSQQTSAHVTTVFEVDLSKVVATRAKTKDRFLAQTGTKLTYMPFIFEAVMDGIRTYPKFNASVDGTNIVYKKDINLGMAVALDWGLIVPVIEHADRLNLVGLATHANDLAERARLKRLSPEEIQGGTFTVTNPGVFGSLFGTPVINQPQVAILCVGAIQKRPVVITDEEGNDGLGIRSMAYLALSYDHRLIDGADAEKFMIVVNKTLQESSWDELAAFLD